MFVQLYGRPGPQYVRRRPGEAFRAECLVPTVKHGGGSIMVWGCMSAAGVGEVFMCEGYMNSVRYTAMMEEVLEASILKLYEDDHPNVYFQQDNAPCHRAKATVRWFAENQVQLLDWPAQSPHLSPIEHLWYILKRNVAKHHCASKEVLRRRIFEQWDLISPELCSNLLASMPRRIKAVISARGVAIKY